MKSSYLNLKNKIDFSIRNFLKLSRKNYSISPQDNSKIFTDKNTKAIESNLLKKYDFEHYKNNSSTSNYLENLYLLDLLDKNICIQEKNEIRVLDLGCKNWELIHAQFAFFKKHTPILHLEGIEIDAFRLNTQFFSRKEIAKFHSKKIPNAKYLAKDFLNQNEKYDYILWILPFVFEPTLNAWGLPSKHFLPKQMLHHALNSLNENGQILILNQGEEEFEEQQKLLEETGATYVPVGKILNDFSPYRFERYLTIAEKINK